VLDVCTGSGCLAVGLGREFAHADIIASDISEDALAVARRNIERHGLSPRVQCRCADLLDGIAGPFDLIVSNPPYVPTTQVKSLQPEVREFEPPAALFAGEDGMQIVRRLLKQAADALAPEGILIFEFGVDQEPFVGNALSRVPSLTLLELKHDLQDIPRAAVVQRSARS